MLLAVRLPLMISLQRFGTALSRRASSCGCKTDRTVRNGRTTGRSAIATGAAARVRRIVACCSLGADAGRPIIASRRLVVRALGFAVV
jgi:hypothetical protein